MEENRAIIDLSYFNSIEQKRIRQGLLKGIELGLELKFGTEGLNLLSEISKIKDLNLLETILNQMKTINTLEELRQIYQPITQK